MDTGKREDQKGKYNYRRMKFNSSLTKAKDT